MENRVYKTKSIVEAGIISAIIIVLMIITGYVPFITFAGTMILPVPVALLYVRHELKITVLAIVASTIITAVLFNPIQAVLSALSFSFVGLILGYAIKKNKNSTYTIFLLTLMSLIATVLTVVLTVVVIQRTSFNVFFTKFINDLNETSKQSIEISKSLYLKTGMTQEQLAQVNSFYAMLTPEFFINMGAAILIMQAFISAVLNYAVAKAILKKLGYNLKNLRSFMELYINSFAAAIIILPIPLGVYLQAKKIPIGKPILVSGQLIMEYVFIIIGISVVTYFLKQKYKLSKGMITLVIISAFIIPTFATVFLYVGLADMIFDFRKVNPDRILKK
jgi:uncharacterized protein YybS (DUF2232 family)